MSIYSRKSNEMTNIRRRFERMRYYAGVSHYALGRYPALFFACLRLREPHNAHHAVRRDTQLVIEGFPRSANTFAEEAFRHAQPAAVRTADHLHVSAQVARAVAYGVPVCVLVREPADAVRSLLIKHRHIRPVDALRGYRRFYKQCLRYTDHMVVATFDQVTSDFGAVTARINQRFGTDFACFDHCESKVEAVFQRLAERNTEFNDGHKLASYYPNVDKLQASRFLVLSDHSLLLNDCQQLFYHYRALAHTPSAGNLPSVDHEIREVGTHVERLG